MHASAIFYSLALLQGVMANPVEGPQPAPEARSLERRTPSFGDIPFPRFPQINPNYKKNGKGNNGNNGNKGNNNNNNNNNNQNCGTNTQTNMCSTGNPYCCSAGADGKQVCSNTTACNSNLICCNNNNGFQICIGDLDFNVPITINIYE